jgi:zinc protease
MSAFDFVIVGNFTPDSVAPLIAQYLGALPGKAPHTPRTGPATVALHDLGLEPPSGVIHKTVARGTEPQATVIMLFYGPGKITPKADWDLYGLTRILQMRLLERLRMQLGGTYAVSAGGTFTVDPTPEHRYSITVSFVCDPHRVNELANAAIAVMDSMRVAPPTALEMNIVREQRLHQLELENKNDGTLLSAIDVFNRERWPLEKLNDDEELIRSWKPGDVTAAARRYFNFHDYARFDLVPATEATASSTQAK